MIKQLLQLYFIMGSNNVLPNQSPLAVLEAALQTGITCFQFREKGTGSLHGKEKTIFAKACQQLCQQYNVPFIVNDDIDLALALQADGVHVGQDDADAAWVRKQLGDKKIIGVSAHTTEEVVTAIENGADYVGMGPVYPTTTKKDAQAVMGTSLIKQTREQFPDLPIVAIGGITLENYAPILQAGADGISIISAIAQSTNPAQTTSLFAKGIREIIG